MELIPEDWALEIETLEAIYMDQFKRVTPNRFQIHIVPNPDSLNEADNAVSVLADITLEKDYPNEIPAISFKQFKGITLKHTKELLELVAEKGKEFLGMQMVFPLIQLIKEWIEEHNLGVLEKLKNDQKNQEEIIKEKEVQEYAPRNYDYQGEAVNKENFTKWFKNFLLEHPEKPQWEDPKKKQGSRLTGKQMFERASSSDICLEQLEEENTDCQIDWSLFTQDIGQ